MAFNQPLCEGFCIVSWVGMSSQNDIYYNFTRLFQKKKKTSLLLELSTPIPNINQELVKRHTMLLYKRYN